MRWCERVCGCCHDEYVDAVNQAVAEGREDRVARLVADYPDAALRVITELEGTAA